MTTKTVDSNTTEAKSRSNGHRAMVDSDEQSAMNFMAHLRGAYGRLMVGQEERADSIGLFDALSLCLLAGGHVLEEDEPGVGKTAGSKHFARLLNMGFNRVQMTPDLLPREIIGYMTPSGFHRGPIFTNVLVVDEIRRASPKTQAGLLEVMEENQATVDGMTYKVEEPFMVMATTNPEEHEGTYPLPLAQMDRFAMFVEVKPPRDRKARGEIARRNRNGGPQAQPFTVGGREIGTDDIRELQRLRQKVEVPLFIDDSYIPALVDKLRDSPHIDRKPTGVRSEIWLSRLAQARALTLGQAEVSVEHVDYVSFGVLPHRFDLDVNSEASGNTKQSVIRQCLEQTAAELGVGA